MKRFLNRGKGVLFALLLVLCAFAVNSFSSVDIEKTAIIIALGIDYSAQDEEYMVTGQLSLPLSGGGAEAPAQTPTMINGRGPSPAAAYNNIAELTGWFPSLSFCTVLVLGSEVTEKPLLDVMDFCLRAKDLNDSVFMCVYEDTAVDFFNQRTPLDQITSFSLLKIFAKENTQSSEVTATTLKQFAMNYYRQGNGNTLPYVTKIEDINRENRSEQDNSKSIIVDLSVGNMVVFDQDRKIAILGEEYVKPYVLMTRPVNTGTINLSNVETSDYTAKNLEVNIQSKPGKIDAKFSEDGESILCRIKLDTTIRILHLESDDKSVKTLVNGRVPDEIKDAVKDKLTREVEALCQKTVELESDILQIEEVLYKSQPKLYRPFHAKYGDHQVLPRTTFEVEVSVKARD